MKLIKTEIIIFSLLIALATSGSPAVRSDIHADLRDSSISQLEQRVSTIDSELEKLARLSMRSGAGSVGCQSAFHDEPDHTEWVQVDLGQPTPIDQVVLVPTIWRDSKTGYDATGLPLQFQILAGTDPDSEGIVLASFTEKDHLTPRTAPIVIPCVTTASWVRVQAFILSQGSWDIRYNLELAELILFNGEENVALRKPVTMSSVSPREGTSRKKEFLVDGFVPYVMDAGSGTKAIPFLSQHNINDQPSILIDLGATYPINRIHLHSFDSSDSVPQPDSDGHALPGWLVMEGAIQADFSDATRLIEYRKESIFDAGPIIMRRFPETRCRYLRLTALELFPLDSRLMMGFAEIEVFSNGENRALHKPADVPLKIWSRPTPLLTDGCNLYGRILPVRQWINELALRHDLERERPIVTSELNHRYARQKENLRWMSWMAALLAAGIIITILIDRMLRMRAVAKTKERFAADLHDELGANIHTIGMLGELARDVESHDELIELLDRARIFTARSVATVRCCTNMLESHDLCENLPEDMRNSTERLLADIEHDLSFEGEEHLSALSPRKRIDIFLFYKESLVNILRHAGATKVSALLSAEPTHLTLNITDNGIGLPDGMPTSLKRRARLLRAQLSSEVPENGGTRIVLKLKLR